MPHDPATPDPLASRLQRRLPGVLPGYLQAQRWFGGKAEAIRSVEVPEIIPIYAEGFSAYLLLVFVEYAGALAQTYALPLVPVSPAQSAVSSARELTDAKLTLDEEDQQARYTLRDALRERQFAEWLIETIRQGGRVQGIRGEIVAAPGSPLNAQRSGHQGPLESSIMKGEQTNTSVRFGESFILKFYRRIEEGVNLDQEIGSFLTEKAHFKYTPPLAGIIQYRQPDRPSATLAILQGYVRNQGDAWEYTLQALDRFVHEVAGRPEPSVDGVIFSRPSLEPVPTSLPSEAGELLGTYLSRIQLLGKRTGELHLALASEPNDPDFAPEPFSAGHRVSMAETIAELAHGSLRLLREHLQILPPMSRQKAERVLGGQEHIFSRLRELREFKSMGLRTRIHGDYHLGQVLVTDDDFAIIDFEGEPETPLSERRLKFSALRDVAGMLRSLQYAASSARIRRGLESDPPSADERRIVRWLRQWTQWVSTTFLQAYLHQTAGGGFLPEDHGDILKLLDVFLLGKAVYELGYELKNRPDWVEIPLDGLLGLL
jgi:maltose alpha-D-glucosyltransferase / alpha-amylase